MTDAPGVTDIGRSRPLVEQAVVTCASCGALNDIWAESCGCGAALLADTRKLKLTKSGGEPHARLERRAKHNEESVVPAEWEQAVRDLAALRSVDGGTSHAPRIAALLLKLDRLQEAAAEATAMHADGHLPPNIAVSLSFRYDALGDLEGANGWLDCGLGSCGDDLKGRIPLLCERSRLLLEHGGAVEALALLEPLETELEAAIKKTEKGGGATVGAVLGGDPHQFAVSYWGAEGATLKAALERAKGVVRELERAQRAAAKQARAEQRAAEGKTHWWQR